MAKRVWTSDEVITKALLDNVLYTSADGESADDLTKLAVKDQSGSGSFALQLLVTETLTADKTLTLTVNNANRIINLTGNLTLAADFTTTTGAITLAGNAGGSSVTLPASGTLATLAGSEQFTNKTLASGTLSGTFTCAATVVNFTTGSITFTTGNLTISGAGYISIGANPASSGYFRISNAQYLIARNAAAGGDVNMIQVSANDFVKFGTTSLEIATANVVTLAFTNPAATRTITFGDPGGADSVAYLAATQTFTGKTINGATLSGTLAGTPTFSGATITFTGNLMNFTAGGAFTLGTTDANTLIIKTGGTTRYTFAAASANLTIASAAILVIPANTATSFSIQDATTKMIDLDSRNTITGVIGVTLTGAPPTITAAAGVTWSSVAVPAVTVTLTGATGVNAMNGVALNIAAPTITSASNPAVAVASTVYISNSPIAAGTATVTLGYALHVAAGTTQLQATNVAGTLTLTNNTFNITAGGAFTFGTTDANTVALKTGGTARWTWAAATANVTLASATDMIVPNTTASIYRIINVAGTLIFAVNSQTATDNVVAFTFTGGPPTIANAASTTYNVVKNAAVTVTLSGATGVTAMSGISLYLDAPTITSATNPAVTLASTLYVAAPVAGGTATITAGYSGHFASAIRVDGNVVMNNAAYDLVIKADTAAAFEIYDATTKLVTINSQVTTDSVVMMTITGQPVTVAAAAGSTYSTVSIAARTHTFTGNTGVTAMNGLQLNLGAPTITSANNPAVALASTLYVAAPVAAGTATITVNYAGHFAGAVRVDGNVSMANAAYDIVVIANTAAALEISDGTTKLLTFDSRNTVTGVIAANFSASPATIASAAGVTYSQVGIAAKTTTVTGTDAVTAMDGLQLNLGVPTLTNVSAGLTITTASTLYVALPVATGNATITNAWTINANGAIRLDGNLSMAAGAYDLIIKANTAVALELSDSTNKLLAVDTRVTTTSISVHTWTAPAPTFVSAAGSTWRHHNVAAVTVTLTGGIGVTAMNGLQMYLTTLTLAADGATTVGIASTLYLMPPAQGANMTITNNYMINTSVAGCFLTAAGVWTDACSLVHKRNVKPLDLARIPELMNTVEVISYRRKDASDGGFERFGVIAEDAPDFLATATHNGVAPQYMAGFSLACGKYLLQENENLKQRVSELEAQLGKSKRRN